MVMKAIIQTVLKILSSKENNFGWPINLLPLSFFPRINTTNHQYFFKNNKLNRINNNLKNLTQTNKDF